MVVAATFSNATYERLPLEEEEAHDGVGGSGPMPGGSPPGLGSGGLSDPSGLPMFNLPPNLMPNSGQLDAFGPTWAHGRPPF
ncbi:hypothetical protein HPP92_002412 [Vanilla planifolia]|nr:hypothetical protein HPP92_002412 [Vanilla planifolia]